MSKILKTTAVVVVGAVATIATLVMSKPKFKAKVKKNINSNTNFLEEKMKLHKNNQNKVENVIDTEEIKNNFDDKILDVKSSIDQIKSDNIEQLQSKLDNFDLNTRVNNNVITDVSENLEETKQEIKPKTLEKKVVKLKDLSQMAKKRMEKYNNK